MTMLKLNHKVKRENENISYALFLFLHIALLKVLHLYLISCS